MDDRKIVEMANLEVDCKIGKDRHFISADRKNKQRIFLGLFAVIGSAAMSSGIYDHAVGLVGSYFSDSHHWSSWRDVLIRILPLLVGISTAVIGFLGLEKQTAQHRYVGNAYIEIARKVRSLLNSISIENYDESVNKYEELLHQYLEVNKEGESSPTNDKDSIKAMKMNGAKRNAIKNRIASFETETLKLQYKKEKRTRKTPWLLGLMFKKVRIVMVSVLLYLKLIRVSDYRKYLRSLS